jgi:hypothetical protein
VHDRLLDVLDKLSHDLVGRERRQISEHPPDFLALPEFGKQIFEE